MKKLKGILLALLFVACISAASIGFAGCGDEETSSSISVEDSSSAEDSSSNNEEKIPSEGLEYTLNEDKVSYSVTGIGTCTDTDIVIPATYNDFPVTTLGERAFEYCKSLTSIEIPDSVTTIGEYEFGCCWNLTNITVNENNTAYKSIDGNLYTKDGTTLIQYAIGKTETEFAIPDSVTTIGKWAFQFCENLTSVEIPDSVTTIGKMAFSCCESLTSIEIPDSVTTLGDFAFDYCDSLASVVIPDGVMSIGYGAFLGCNSLTFNEYGNCKYLGNESNPYHALVGKTDANYTTCIIHENVKVIVVGAFEGCDNLTSITFNGTVEEWNAISKGNRWNDYVPATEVVCKDGSVAL